MKKLRRRIVARVRDWPLLPRNSGDFPHLDPRFAVGVVCVYCFLSRRGGDSEELFTGWPNPPIRSQVLVAL